MPGVERPLAPEGGWRPRLRALARDWDDLYEACAAADPGATGAEVHQSLLEILVAAPLPPARACHLWKAYRVGLAIAESGGEESGLPPRDWDWMTDTAWVLVDEAEAELAGWR